MLASKLHGGSEWLGSTGKRASKRLLHIAGEIILSVHGASQSVARNSLCGLARRAATTRRREALRRRQLAETVDSAVRIEASLIPIW